MSRAHGASPDLRGAEGVARGTLLQGAALVTRRGARCPVGPATLHNYIMRSSPNLVAVLLGVGWSQIAAFGIIPAAMSPVHTSRRPKEIQEERLLALGRQVCVFRDLVPRLDRLPAASTP